MGEDPRSRETAPRPGNPPGAEEAHPSAAELAEFDRGGLEPVRWHEVEHHLLHCAVCAEQLTAMPTQTLDELVRELDKPRETVPVPAADATPSLPDSFSAPPELLGHARYRVLEAIDAGGMGRVYRAEHRLMGRIVALKVLKPGLLGDPAAVERFRREVRAAARLAHPNIVTAYDADEVGSIHFLVMEYVEGVPFNRLVAERGPLPAAEVCGWIRQVAEGLRYAHERGMVHRDLKPANLILAADGVVKILDFGLARLAGEPAGGSATPSATIVGTPQYTAPEQAREPRTADARADLYSLGCTWYCLLTGRPPFPRGTVLQELLAHQQDSIPPLGDVGSNVPPPMQAILFRLLAKDPGQRFPSALALLHALDAAAPPRMPARWRHWSWALGIAAAVVVAAAVGLIVLGRGGFEYAAALRVTSAQSQEFLAEKVVFLSNLKIEDAAALDGDRGVRGSVTYRTQAPVRGNLALRLTFLLGTSTRTHYTLLNQRELAGGGELRFEFEAPYSGPPRTTGPHVLFIDLSELNAPGRSTQALVLSNTVASLVTIQDPKSQHKVDR